MVVYGLSLETYELKSYRVVPFNGPIKAMATRF